MDGDDPVAELIARALAEDLGDGDLTTDSIVPADSHARARIVQKEPGVLFGLDVATEVFRRTGAGELEAVAAEGEWRADVPADVASVAGPARALLAAERVALNLLAHLSGIATLTATFVTAAASEAGGAAVLDTRKTTPGMRALEKAAVAAGGGVNHRMGLFDAILIKENHAVLAGGLAEAVRRVRVANPGRPVEVEARDLDETAAALASGAERILLDNMGIGELRESVSLRDRAVDAGHPRASLEASGGVSLETVGAISATGVDFVSVGALTHSAPALDLSMLLDPAPAV